MRRLLGVLVVGVLAGALLLLAGCGGYKPAPMKAEMDSLVGSLTYAQALEKWGEPHSVSPKGAGKVAMYQDVVDVYVQRMFMEFDGRGVLTAWKSDTWCCADKKSGP